MHADVFTDRAELVAERDALRAERNRLSADLDAAIELLAGKALDTGLLGVLRQAATALPAEAAEELCELREERNRLREALRTLLDTMNTSFETFILGVHRVFGRNHRCRECDKAQAALDARNAARAVLEGKSDA